jgi:hypothetical protein
LNDENKRGWHRLFPDPGSAAVMLVVALIGLAAGGGSTYVVKSNATDTETITRTETQTETVTVAEEGGEEVVGSGLSGIGLDELNGEEEVQDEDLFEYEFGIRNIAGHEYENAFLVSVYPEEGPVGLTVNTKGQYSSISFVAGVDAETSCPKSKARVWVEDETGHVLWGPARVGITTPARAEELPMADPIQVNLVTRSSEGEGSCNYGKVDVAWGGVRFNSSSD